MANISPKLRALLDSHDLDIDQTIALLKVQDYQLEGKSNLEIMETLMKAAEQQIKVTSETELAKIILRETIKGYKPDLNEEAAAFHDGKNWRQ